MTGRSAMIVLVALSAVCIVLPDATGRSSWRCSAWAGEPAYAQRSTTAEEEYDVGGPLFGVKLPPYPTQHGEAPGHPGCIPELAAEAKKADPKSTRFTSEGLPPEPHLYPGSVEHWRAYWYKYLPVHSSFDRQSLMKNWLANDLAAAAGPGESTVEEYAEPVYWVPRHADVVDTGLRNKPVPVVRCKPGSAPFQLGLGELPAGLYALRIIGAVEMKDIVRHRKPLRVTLCINDCLDGGTSTYRLRLGYVDEFYSIAEFYFHAPEKRVYKAQIGVAKDSAVDLLIHNVDLHDVLAGTVRRPIKTRATLTTPGPQKPAPATPKDEKRWARDAELWDSMPPLNAMLGHVYGMGGDDPKGNWPNIGAGGKTPEEIAAQWGAWTRAAGATLLVNEKLKLNYTLDDLRAGRPLPDPYPFKDDGTGVYTPPPTPDADGQNWYPVANGVCERMRWCTAQIGAGVNQYRATGDAEAARDAAVMLCRFAWHFPTIDPANSTSALLVQPGPYGRDMRCRRRDNMAIFADANIIELYDQLFEFIKANDDLAASIGRFAPWVKKSEDVVQLLDTYLVQTLAKRYIRYHYYWSNEPAKILTPVIALGDPKVTDPWLAWLFSRTFVYPLPPSGLQDLMVTGNDRDGVGYIGSYYYAQVEEAASKGEVLENYIQAGGNPKYDLRHPKRYPKVTNCCYWFLRSPVAGLYFPRVGDVTGPEKGYGNWFELYYDPMMRRGWRWTHDPQFAYVVNAFFGRKGESDQDWKAIETAAATVKRAPWLENRSRVLPNWCGVLESGVEHDDSRFRRAALLRIGQGWGHAHYDSLDLQIMAHGYPATIDGGQRPGYSSPGDAATRIHNVVEVDGAAWKGHAWVRTLSDAPGARYLTAEAQPPANLPNVQLHRRQLALIDVDEGAGSQPLTPEQLRPRAQLPPNVVTPNSYVFDVVRVTGGKTHTYCFHGTVDDELVTNAEAKQTWDQMPEADKQYLGRFPDKQRSFAGDAPGVFEATWRLTRDQMFGNERGMAAGIWDETSPRKHTRLLLFGHKGDRVLSGQAWCNQWKYGFSNVWVQQRRQEEGSALFTAVIEPFVGEPFITASRALTIAENESDALAAAAVEIKTKNGHTDVCFADGRPDKTRLIALGAPAEPALRIAGEFAFYSTDQAGVRQAALMGGTLLAAPNLVVQPAAAARIAAVIGTDYPERTLTIDQSWPAEVLKGRAFEVGVPGHMTTYTISDVRPAEKASAITVLRGADFYLSRVQAVDSETGIIVTGLGFPQTEDTNPSPGQDKGWVASNEDMTKFWRADYAGASREEKQYRFKLTGGPVRMEDFGESKGFYLWEYGVGDAVRMSTFVGLRRIETDVYELTSDVDLTLTLRANALEVSRDKEKWQTATIEQVGGHAQMKVTLKDLGREGRLYLRVRQ